jgi:large subunit ribosomal protein L34
VDKVGIGQEKLTFSSISGILYTIRIMSITYNPKKKKRSRTHGFLKRMRSAVGQRVIKQRRRKGRKELSV